MLWFPHESTVRNINYSIDPYVIAFFGGSISWLQCICKKIIHQKNKHFLQDQLKDRQNNRSRLCDLPSTWSKCQSGATSTRIPFSTITGRNSQHTANVSPHFLCLLRQPRGSIRSSRVPTRGENDKHVLAYSTVMGRTFQISFLLMFTERHSILLV